MKGSTRPPLERMEIIHQMIVDAMGKKRIFKNPYPNTNDFSKELEVDNKTVARDLGFMRDRLKLPIQYDRKKYGYYYTEKVNAFPSIQLTERELFSLVVAQKAIAAYRGTAFEEPLKNTFRKLIYKIPKDSSIHILLDDWDRSVVFQGQSMHLGNSDHFDQLAQAVIYKKQLIITYKRPNQKEISKRQIDPIQMLHLRGEWYLLAWCYVRNALRIFHPMRIQSIKETGQKCNSHSKVSVEEYLKNSLGIYAGQKEQEIELLIDSNAADYFRERKWHHSQENQELPQGQLRVTFKLNSLYEIERWILSWGGLIQALKPKELIDRINKSAQKLVTCHKEKTNF